MKVLLGLILIAALCFCVSAALVSVLPFPDSKTLYVCARLEGPIADAPVEWAIAGPAGWYLNDSTTSTPELCMSQLGQYTITASVNGRRIGGTVLNVFTEEHNEKAPTLRAVS